MRKQRVLVTVLSAAAILSAGQAFTSMAAARGWVQQENEWVYLDSSGEPVTNEWKKKDGKWVYLDDDGFVSSSQWVEDSQYVDEKGNMVVNQWIYAEEDESPSGEEGWFYLNAKGKAVAEGCDVIFCPVSIAYSTQIVKLAADTGLTIPILGSDTLDSNMVLEAASGSDVQLYVSTFYQEGGSPEFDEGIKAFINGDSTNLTNNGGNDTIAAVTAMGYDAYYVALEALKAAGSTDPGAVKAALPGVTYTGVSGDIAFDEIGDAIRDTAYIKVADTANNAWTLETVQTVAQ